MKSSLIFIGIKIAKLERTISPTRATKTHPIPSKVALSMPISMKNGKVMAIARVIASLIKQTRLMFGSLKGL